MNEQQSSAGTPAPVVNSGEKAPWQTPAIAIVGITEITRFDVAGLDDGLGGNGGAS